VSEARPASGLEPWGWDPAWEAQRAALARPDAVIARVVGQDRGRWAVQTVHGARTARPAPSTTLDPYPTVGDWVACEPVPPETDPLSVLSVLPRRAAFSRASAGDGRAEQALASNVDDVWVVHGLDAPLNPRRLERYLAFAWESGAQPALVLTKADLATDLEAALAVAADVAFGVTVHRVSALDEASISSLRGTLAPGRTVVLLGPSGAGKSTLLNALAGSELAKTAAVRDGDRKGRHTTTRRELFPIEGGALVIDTPGVRELRVWALDEGLERAFPDIDELASGCRFRDCRHHQEPGCAVLAAVAAGELAEERLASFRKLQAEAAHVARKSDYHARKAAISEHKTAMKTMAHHHKRRGGA